MSEHTSEALDRMRREVDALRRQVRLQQWGGAALVCCVLLAVAFGAAPAAKEDARFGRISARSLSIVDDKGEPAVQVYAVEGGGAILLRGPDGREAVHLVAGPERNDVIVYDRSGAPAAAVQGLGGEGRFSLHKTFASKAAAEAAMAPLPVGEYSSRGEGKAVTVPTVQLPAAVP